jgi:hypothetical protein
LYYNTRWSENEKRKREVGEMYNSRWVSENPQRKEVKTYDTPQKIKIDFFDLVE